MSWMESFTAIMVVFNLWLFIFQVLPSLIASEGGSVFDWVRVGVTLSAMLVSCFWLGASLARRLG